MANLKKVAVAVTAGVWASALGSAVALAYVLNRPLEPKLLTEPETAHASVAHLHESAAPLVLRAATSPRKVTPARIPAVVAKPPADVHPDITEMKCHDWRELQVGSGSVQVCE
jgi:hypothetical protein